MVQTADAIIIGGGVIGLALAVELRRTGLSVIVLEKHQPGREASWAAGGMLAYCEAGNHPLFRQLAIASAEMYPAFVHRLQDESGISADLRQFGTIVFLDDENLDLSLEGKALSPQDLRAVEPELRYSGSARLLPEACVDPRLLTEALLKSAIHLGVHVASGAGVTHLEIAQGRPVAAVTSKTRYSGQIIVNCAGAWAGQFSPVAIPANPVKGQMLALIPRTSDLVKHVIRGNGVYVIPRGDGRIVVGSTVENCGFDKRVDPATIQRLHQDAAVLIPQLGEALIHDDWAGLRPGTPDKLPIMGRTSIEGYFVSTGHYRDGILLAPISAHLLAQTILGQPCDFRLEPFSPDRF